MKLRTKALIAIGVLTLGASACKKNNNSSSDSDLIGYEENGNGYSVVSISNTNIEKLTIPSTYKGSPVTLISDNALLECKNLKTISLPNSLTSISSSLFKNTKIEYNTYKNGYYLGDAKNPYMYLIASDDVTEVSLHADTLIIGDNVFNGMAITKAELNNKLKKISYQAFYDNDMLYSITIPGSLTEIEDMAFYSCDNLFEIHNKSNISITLGSISNGYIAYNARIINTSDKDSAITYTDDYIAMTYDSKKYLLKYTGSSLTPNISGFDVIGEGAFQGSNITEIATDAKIIEDMAFKGCKSLKKAILSNDVEEIGAEAFEGNTSLTEVVLGSGINAIHNNAFKDCRILKYVYYNGNENSWASIVFDYDTTDNMYSNPMKYATDILFLSSGEYQKPTSLNISAKRINVGQFMNFTSVKSISLSNVEEINSFAFMGCSSLEELSIPNTVKTLEASIVEGCISLKDLYVDKNVESVSSILGATDYKIKNLHYSGDASDWEKIVFVDQYSAFGNYVENVYFTKDNTEYIPTEINLSSNVSNYTYMNIKSIKSVYIDKTVTRLGAHVFFGCDSIEGAYYNGSVDEWVRITFSTFTSNPLSFAKSLHILDEDNQYVKVANPYITSSNIRAYVFYNSDISSVIIDKSVRSVGFDAFMGCNNLVYVYYLGALGEGIASVEDEKLKSLYVYYYSEERPSTEGRFWHYDSQGVPERW